MIAYSTRNRPHVLEYSLRKTREEWGGFIIVIDDNSDTKTENERICKQYDCAYTYNEKRRGIPRTKHRGFMSLLTFDRQIWMDDDCFLKPGAIEKIIEAQKEEPHLLHLKGWAHIRPVQMYDKVVEYSGATACFMAFTKGLYKDIHGFQVGHGIYGGWHHELSMKLSAGYFAMRQSSRYIHSFDIDSVPPDFEYAFNSSLPIEERKR